MAGIIISIIEFGTAVFALTIVLIAILFALKMFKRNSSSATKEMEEQEARMIQEIYQSLYKMEERVEALETILLEKERKDKS